MALFQVNSESSALGGAVSFDVILPQALSGVGTGAPAPGGRPAPACGSIPVLWLLHGATDDHTIWRRRTAVERYVEPLGLAVVMPAAALSSYTDMAYGKAYFTYIAEELPELCRRMFPGLSDRREDNFLAGLSMGCYGAFKIALTLPGRYAAAGGFSAGNSIFNRNIPAFFRIEKRNMTVFGTPDATTLGGTAHDLYHLAETAAASARNRGDGALPKIYHACGTEDFAYGNACELRDRMRAIPGDPYRYEFHDGPGGHTWEFWDEWLRNYLASTVGPLLRAARGASV